MPTNIAIQNRSTVVSDAQVQQTVAALQIQIDRDFAPAWRTTATLQFLTRNDQVPAGSWIIYIMDDSNVQGALGYHDEIRSTISGRVFARTAQRYGYNWTVTLSHELLEMMANPYINLSVFKQTSAGTGSIYFYEIADPCQADRDGYRINDILVSNFVYPTWFDLTPNGPGTQYDQCRKITSPFQILRGGYMSIYRIGRGSGWSTITQNNILAPTAASDDRNRMQRRIQ